MEEVWKQYENWLAANWPNGLKALNPPASEAEITALENAIGINLPSDFIECLKIHNGQSDESGLFDRDIFLSTHEILREWAIWKELLDSEDFKGYESEPEIGVRNDWWHSKWIPFTANGYGDNFCLDLAPIGNGNAGQILSMLHDDPRRGLLAPNFEAWFSKYVSAVIAGDYVFSEKEGCMVLIDK